MSTNQQMRMNTSSGDVCTSDAGACKHGHGCRENTYMAPGGIRFINAACEANGELGRDHAWLPVAHTSGGNEVGMWFYYARGCSDFYWNSGRTLLVRNRYDLALRLHDLVAVAHGGTLMEQSASNAIAAELLRSHRVWALTLLQRVKTSRYTHVQHYFRRNGASPPDLGSIVLDAARGFYVNEHGTSRRCHCLLNDYKEGALQGKAKTRSRALAQVLLPDASALDILNARLLKRLCDTRWQLDTVQLSEQPAGHHSQGCTYHNVEIWDVRWLCLLASQQSETQAPEEPNATRSHERAHKLRQRLRPGGPWLGLRSDKPRDRPREPDSIQVVASLASAITRISQPVARHMTPFDYILLASWKAGLFGSANGSWCEPSPLDEWRKCLSCKGSAMQRACAAARGGGERPITRQALTKRKRASEIERAWDALWAGR